MYVPSSSWDILKLLKKMLFMWNSNLIGYLAFSPVQSDSPGSWTHHLFHWWPWKMSEVRFLWSTRKERMIPQPGSAWVVGVQAGLQREETRILVPTPPPEPCGERRTSPGLLTCKEHAPIVQGRQSTHEEPCCDCWKYAKAGGEKGN